MTPSRRSFLTGLASLIAAPAIVRVTSLMPVKAMPSVEDINALLKARMDECYRITAQNLSDALYGNLTNMTRAGFAPRLHIKLVGDWPSLEWGVPVTFENNGTFPPQAR